MNFGETPYLVWDGGYKWTREWNASTTFDWVRSAQEPSTQCGDLLIRDRLGNWTYQFAVTVDDWLQEIDLVIRGIDLLESTGRQIRLARLLGRQTPPCFLHHGLVMKSDDAETEQVRSRYRRARLARVRLDAARKC